MANPDTIKAPPVAGVLRRDISFDVRAMTVDQTARTIELSFSSEVAYERCWGIEILDHGKKSVRLGRLRNRAALLINHDPEDQVGVVESVSIGADRIGRAVVRFGKSQDAEEAFQDVVDGIRCLTSVGYVIHAIQLEKSEGDVSTYRVTDWEPYEISLVSIPADPSVGVGRDSGDNAFDPRTLLLPAAAPVAAPIKETKTMTEPTAPAAAPAAAPVVAAPAAPVVNDAAIRELAIASEMQRQANIRSTGARIPEAAVLVDQAISERWDVSRFLDEVNNRSRPAVATPTAEAPIGITRGDAERFRLTRFLRALLPTANAQDRSAAKFELEMAHAANERAVKEGRTPHGLMVPSEVLALPIGRNFNASQRQQLRAMTVGTATAGGNLVENTLDEASFIDVLRNKTQVAAMGATFLDGLTGNLLIPRQTGASSATWVAENAAGGSTQPAFDQITLSPKTLIAYVDVSRQLLLQASVSTDAFVMMDLAKVIAIAVDLAAINGSGASNQPRGVMQTSGIGSVAGGTNGATVTYANVVALETAVAVANADLGALGYLTNATQRGVMKGVQKFATTNGQAVWDGDEVNGYKGYVSNQVPKNLVKGASGAVCSAILFGNWADLLIGEWGGLDFLVDPYTGSSAGTIRVNVYKTVDISVRHPESFSAMLDAL